MKSRHQGIPQPFPFTVLHLRLALGIPYFQSSLISLTRPLHSLGALRHTELAWLIHLPSLSLLCLDLVPVAHFEHWNRH